MNDGPWPIIMFSLVFLGLIAYLGYTLNEGENHRRNTGLRQAAVEGDGVAIAYWLAKGADPSGKINYDGQRNSSGELLLFACRFGRLSAVRVLLADSHISWESLSEEQTKMLMQFAPTETQQAYQEWANAKGETP